MKKTMKSKLSIVLSLVLAVVMMISAVPVTVYATSTEESDKLVDMFYDEVFREYYDDVYTLCYDYAIKLGMIDGAIAEIDAVIAMIEEYKAQIPEVPDEVPEVPDEEWPEEIPEEVWDDVPGLLEQIPPEMLEQVPEDIIVQMPSGTLDQISSDIIGQVPVDILEKIPQDTLEQMENEDLRNQILSKLEQNGIVLPITPVVYSLRSVRSTDTSNAYTEYVKYVNTLKAECDELLNTLNEIKDILEGNHADYDLTTWEGLVDTIHYLEEELPERIDRIKVLWAVIAAYIIDGAPMYDENTDSEQVRDDFINGIENLVKLENTINNDVIPAIEEALKVVADVMYDPACSLLELLLDTQIDSAEGLVEALGDVSEMTEEEFKARVDEIIYEATHAELKIDCDSYYVAFGDNTAAGDSYVGMLAEKLGVKYSNLAKAGLSPDQLVAMINGNAAKVEKADMITLGLGGAADLVDIMNHIGAKKTDSGVDWDKYLDEKGFGYSEKVKEAVALLCDELTANGYDGESAAIFASSVELYAYNYIEYAVEMHEAIEAVKAINPDALVVVVGMYNPLSGVVYNHEGTEIDLGSYVDYLFTSVDVYNLVYSILSESTTFVSLPTIEVINVKAEMDITNFATLNVSDLLPSEAGHESIVNQIMEALTVTGNTEHVFGDWAVSTDPTCTAKGEETRTCTICGEVETRELDIVDHVLGDWTQTKAPTCTEKGEAIRVCTICGEVLETKELDMIDHAFGEWTQTKAPTCTEKGEETRTCTICGEVETRELDAVDHVLGDWTQTKAPTCTEKGEETRTCTICGEVLETRELDMIDHNFGDWTQTKAPTCTAKGEATRTCSACGLVETKEIDMIEHEWVWIIDKEATKTEVGYKHEECKICGAKRNENTVIPTTPSTGDTIILIASIGAVFAVAGVVMYKRKRFN